MMKSETSNTVPPPGHGLDEGRYIYRPYRTDKNGNVLWAKNYGLKAWRIWAPTGRPATNDPTSVPVAANDPSNE